MFAAYLQATCMHRTHASHDGFPFLIFTSFPVHHTFRHLNTPTLTFFILLYINSCTTFTGYGRNILSKNSQGESKSPWTFRFSPVPRPGYMLRKTTYLLILTYSGCLQLMIHNKQLTYFTKVLSYPETHIFKHEHKDRCVCIFKTT